MFRLLTCLIVSVLISQCSATRTASLCASHAVGETDMGFLSRFFHKSCDMRTAEELFATCLSLIQVDLYSNLRTIYSSQMNDGDARTLAAQVVSFLKAEDIDEIARASGEPLRSRIMAVLPQVEQRAEECMQTDPHTREIIVATLRMTSLLMFGKYGKAWFRDPAKTRIEKLLVRYGPEFPQEITPPAYAQLTDTYHALKKRNYMKSTKN